MDIALIVCSAKGLSFYEADLIKRVRENNTPAIIVINKVDEYNDTSSLIAQIKDIGLPTVATSARTGEGIETLRSLNCGTR